MHLVGYMYIVQLDSKGLTENQKSLSDLTGILKGLLRAEMISVKTIVWKGLLDGHSE